MRKTDLAYVAGIVDGEGCIGLYKQSRGKNGFSLCIQVTINNTNEWIIQWLKFSFGGNLYAIKAKEANWKPQWEWKIEASKALEFLKLVSPYLRLKKPQAEVAIKFQELRRGSGHHLTEEERGIAEAQRILMANLNKRGVKQT